MGKIFIPVKIFIFFLLAGSPALTSSWLYPSLETYTYPQDSSIYYTDWYESPMGIFSLGFSNSNVNPAVTAPSDHQQNSDTGKCEAAITISNVSYSGNTLTWSMSGATAGSGSGQVGTYTFAKGETTIVFTTQGENNSTAQDTMVITVVDGEDPKITLGNDISETTDTGQCTAAIAVPNAGFSDNCPGEALSWAMTGVTAGNGSGQVGTKTFNIGTTTITYTVADAAGKTVNQSIDVTVTDGEDPKIILGNDISDTTDTDQCTAAIAVPNAGFSDNCPGEALSWAMIGVTTGNGSGQVGTKTFNIGTSTITYTVTDAAGRTVTQSIDVTVTDGEDPKITLGNDIFDTTDTGQCTAAIAVPNASFSDNCPGEALSWAMTGVTTGNGSGQVGTKTFNIGTTTITYTVTDAAGKTVTQSLDVIIADEEPPAPPTLSTLENWSCGKEIPIPTTQDNCSGEIKGVTEKIIFDSPGEYIVTWTFTDEKNNTSTANQTIKVPVPTVDIPSIDGTAFCNTEVISSIAFTGNTLDNKSYAWSYKSPAGGNLDIGIASSGTGNIPEFTAKNNTSEFITAVFTVTPFGNDCEGSPETFSIIVHPTPSVTKPNDILICEGETVNLVDLSNVSVTGSIVTWTNDNTIIGLPANGTGNINSFTATNGTNVPQVATVSLTPSANECSGPIQMFTITVKPKPSLETPVIPELCNGLPTSIISLTGNLSGITYDITGGSSIGLSNKTGVSQIPVFTPANNSTSPVTTTLKITPTANGCIGEPIEVPVTVKPSPVVNTSFTGEICSGEETDIALTSPVANTGFTWTVDAPAQITGAINGSFEVGADHIIKQQLVNNSTVPQLVTYKITPNANGCTGTIIPVQVTVNPTPQFEVTLPECATSVNLTDPSIKNINELTYTYWSDAAASVEINNPAAVSLGTYYVKGQSNAGCTAIQEVIVDKIKPIMVNAGDAPAEICSGEVFDFLPESSLEGTTISWSRAAVGENPATNSSDRNNINPNESLVNKTGAPITAHYTFTLEYNGCTNEFLVEVEISPQPQLIQQPISDICNGSSINYTPQSSISNSTITWRRNAFEGNAASSGSGTINEVLYNDSGVEIGVTYFITITSAKGCVVEESVNFSLLSGPKVTATASKNNLCPGETIDLLSTYEGEQQSVDPVLLDENFNGSAANWTKINNSYRNASASNWTLRPNNYSPGYNYNIVSNDGSQFFLSNSDAQGSYSNTETILQYKYSINTVGYTSLEISFWQDYVHYSSKGIVEVSTDNVNWFPEYSTPGSNSKGLISFDLNGWTGKPNLYIRFKYTANWGYWWAIDNVKITGEGSTVPDVTWTSSTNPEWTSNEQNPSNISVSRTTIFTATYTDPDLECPGVGTVEVTVKEPLQPKIIANYCSLDQTNQVLLSVEGTYDTYRWVASGQTISTNESLQVSLAQTYTLYVTKDGCEASASITPNENLVVNGDFENGNTNDFETAYYYVTNNPNRRDEMWPEGTYAVGEDAYNYHSNFQGRGHGGRGNFMIVNGDQSIGNVVWQSNTIDIIPDTDYYFSAWTSNVNPSSPARLRLQLFVPGQNTPLVESTLGDLTNQPVGNWINFYNPELWNSGNHTQVVLRIINENPTAGGNDFGIDDISFSAFRSFDFEFTPENNGPICEDETLKLTANLDGARFPITFDWTGPNGFSRSKTITQQSERVAADTLLIPNSTVAMAGEYSLQITDFYGCNLVSKTTVVEIIEKAVVFAGSDMEICSNEPVIDLSGASIEHPTVTSGFWTTASGDNSRFTDPNSINTTYNPNEAEIASGAIELILTSNEDSGQVCEVVSDTIKIVFNKSPEVILTSQDVTCFGDNNGKIEINITQDTGTSPFTYQWSNGFTGRIAENLIAGEYYADVTDAKGCTVRTDTITIKQPEELIVGMPVQLEEASCFDENSSVVAIPVSGGLFPEDTIDPDNIPYTVEILNAEGEDISLGEQNINYEVSNSRFVFTGLQGGVAYTFLINTFGGCNATVKSFTTITPPEINAGEAPTNMDCGVKLIWLNATPIDPAQGTGSWTYNGGETELLGDPTQANSSFTGEPGVTYTLTWTVSSAANTNCLVSEELSVTFPPGCSRLNFDGEDDFVDLGDHYSMVGSSLSIEGWIKPGDLSGTRTIFSKRDEDDLNSGYDLILNNGAPAFRVGNKSVISVNTLTTDRWFHIAGVYTGQQLELYVDGILIKSNSGITPNAIIDNNSPAIIGATYASSTSGSKNNFSGFIEELRIWNTGIPVEQIRFFMNQRLEKTGTEVSGTVLGNNLNLSNAPEAVSWDKLAGYYQLLAVGDLISDGFTDNLGTIGAPADGLLKNIEEMQENTAPLPYKLFNTNGNWFDSTTWQLPVPYNGVNITQRDVWNSPNSLGINGDRINWNIVNLNGNKVINPSTANNITLLGLLDHSGTLDLQGENNKTGTSLTITHYLELNGYLDLNGESQLLQTVGSILAGNGYLDRDQQGTASSHNYNYWSSPVSTIGMAPNSGYKIGEKTNGNYLGVLYDGTDPTTPKEIQFNSQYHYADGAPANPIKISSYWLNKFFGKAGEYSSWQQITPGTHLETGEGFTMKGSSGYKNIQDLQNYTFRGMPNNGTITLTIGLDQNYLIGNPYPSAIDANKFIRDNLKNVPGGTNSKNVFNGSIYFWSHFAEKTHILKEYVGGYAIYNLAGGIQAIANDARINNNNPNRKGGRRPRQYIAVGQGFFINTVLNPALSLNPNVTITGGDVEFNNSQRVFQTESDSTKAVFHSVEKKTIRTSSIAGTIPKEEDRMQLWIRFKSPAGYHRQLLVTRDPLTTSGFDLGYDAPLIENNKEDMYWLMGKEQAEMVIQGVPDFDIDRELPLGIKLSTEGEFTIGIDDMNNIPAELPIFVKDSLKDTYHNLRDSDFKTTIETGEIHGRYSIIFNEEKEETDDPDDGSGESDGEGNGEGEGDGEGNGEGEGDGEGNGEGEGSENPEPQPNPGGIELLYSSKYREVLIKNPGMLAIDRVVLFNSLGQELGTFNNIETKNTIVLPIEVPSQGMYFVRIYVGTSTSILKFLVE